MIVEKYKWLTDIYVAHRGLFNNTTVPENSVPAFEQAREYAFGIETDVQMTSDGVLVVFHDDDLKRMTGAEGLVREHTFEQLRQLRLLNTEYTIPTFEEFLQSAGGVNLVVEIKTHPNIGELEQKVYDMLKTYNGNYCIESFDPFIIRWFKLNAPEVIRGQLSCDHKQTNKPWYVRWLLRNLVLCKWNGSQFIAFDHASVAKNKAVKRYAKKMPIICWTIRSQQEFDNAKDYFDNIIFDSYLPKRLDLEKSKWPLTQE